jgi:hypothetical protein
MDAKPNQNNNIQLQHEFLSTDACVNRDEIYIAMVTGHNQHYKVAYPNYRAWIRHFNPNNAMLITSANDDKLVKDIAPSILSVVSNTGDSQETAQERFIQAIFRIYELAKSRNDQKAKFFLIVDDDTFIIPKNMMRLLARMRAKGQDEEMNIASRCEFMDGKYHFLGGSGVIMTRPAIEAITAYYRKCPEHIGPDMYFYDVSVSRCFRRILDSNPRTKGQPNCIDQIELHRDHPKDQCNQEGLFNNDGNIYNHMGENVASFHYMNAEELVDEARSWFPDYMFEETAQYCADKTELLKPADPPVVEEPTVEHLTEDDIFIAPVKLGETANEAIKRVWSDVEARGSKWVVFAREGSCVSTLSLANILSKHRSSEILYVGGETSRLEMKKKPGLTYGAGFAVTNEWLRRAASPCLGQECEKQIASVLKDNNVVIRQGVILHKNPVEYCTKSGRFHYDTRYRFDRLNLSIFPAYEEDKCVPDNFWKWRKDEEKKKYANYKLVEM